MLQISHHPDLRPPGNPRGRFHLETTMTDLTAAKRKNMPKSEFAGKDRSFPVNDKNHARLAISGATRSERAGNISEGTAERIKARARMKLKDLG
jgi:hypothetical protein